MVVQCLVKVIGPKPFFIPNAMHKYVVHAYLICSSLDLTSICTFGSPHLARSFSMLVPELIACCARPQERASFSTFIRFG